MADLAAALLHGCCLVGIAIVLAGCGGGGDDGPKKTSVILMRHCARSMPEAGIYADPSLPYFANYSQRTWPAFSVPDFYCTAYGEKVVEQQGEWFKEHGNLPMPLSVIADTSERDNVTGRKFVQGLGLNVNEIPFSLNKVPFSYGTGTPACPEFTNDEYKAAIAAQLQRYPNVSQFSQIGADMLKFAGAGVYGNWTVEDCKIEEDTSEHPWAPIIGGCNIAAEFSERFLMESGSGLEVGWKQFSTDEIPKYLAMHAWYLQVSLNSPELHRRKSAPLAYAILEFLEAGTQGTRALIGHDTNEGGLNGVLGLQWDPSPWPVNGTMPGSMLRFDLEDDTVTVSFAFVEDFTKGGDMKTVPAALPGFPDGKVSLKALRGLVEKGTDYNCSNPTRTRTAVDVEVVV